MLDRTFQEGQDGITDTAEIYIHIRICWIFLLILIRLARRNA